MQSLLAQIAGWLPAIPRSGWGTAGCIKPRLDERSSRERRGTYGAVWRVLDLRYFVGSESGGTYGVPQCRERLYLVLRRGEAPAAEVLLDEEDLARISGEIEQPEDAGVDADGADFTMSDRTIPFVWRAGGHMASPIVPRDTLPTISGDNVALADPIRLAVRRLMPEEIELAYTLPNGWTATGLKSRATSLLPISIKDAPRYRMLGRETVPPAIVEWIARRMFA